MSLGDALSAVGRGENDRDCAEQAIDELRVVLKIFTRDQSPLNWIRAQMSLASAVQNLGELEGGTTRLEEAAALYCIVLPELKRDQVPMLWAQAQSGYGGALLRLGALQMADAPGAGVENVKNAIIAMNAALEERTYKRFPFVWAAMQRDLGVAFTMLGEHERDMAHLNAALAAYDAALAVFEPLQATSYIGTCRANRDEVIRLINQQRADSE